MSRTPETLSLVEESALLAELTHRRYRGKRALKATRNKLIALLMLDAGLRVGEVVQLRVRDLWILGHPAQSVTVTVGMSKTNTARNIPLSPRIQLSIVEMREIFWTHTPPYRDSFAFCVKCPESAMTIRQVERLILAAGHKATHRHITPHMLRHTFATKLMRKVPTRVVQELLGHKNLSSTQIYQHPNQADKEAAISSLTD